MVFGQEKRVISCVSVWVNKQIIIWEIPSSIHRMCRTNIPMLMLPILGKIE